MNPVRVNTGSNLLTGDNADNGGNKDDIGVIAPCLTGAGAPINRSLATHECTSAVRALMGAARALRRVSSGTPEVTA